VGIYGPESYGYDATTGNLAGKAGVGADTDAPYSCFCCQNNPAKHSLVERVADWRWSSFHR